MVEAFTPSTISKLYDTLRQLPIESRPEQDWPNWVRRARAGSSSQGWADLGYLRPPESFVLGPGRTDPSVPDGVEAIWLSIFYPTPSLTLVIATFTIAEEHGDVSAFLRNDYSTAKHSVRIEVPGPLGALRAKIPWSRPARYHVKSGMHFAAEQKRVETNRYTGTFETTCADWFFERFRGRFSIEPTDDRPIAALFLTKETVPFKDRPRFLAAVGLDEFLEVWRSKEPAGWSFCIPHASDGHKTRYIFAARRSDAASSPGGNETGDTAWSLTQRFHEEQGQLVAYLALVRLVVLYSERLGHLRDVAGRRQRRTRPVRRAKAFDAYLSSDGLDASTVAHDLRSFATDLQAFRWNVAEYAEDQGWRRPEAKTPGYQPSDLLPGLRAQLISETDSLTQSLGVVTPLIAASADLQQAIANTRLQRMVLFLSIVATFAAIVSLLR